MKKLILLTALLSLLTFCTMAQVLRVATSPSAITSQIPGYSQVNSINTKTIAYTPSLPPSYPAPVSIPYP